MQKISKSKSYLAVNICLIILLASCTKEKSLSGNDNKYANKEYWAYYPKNDSCHVDVFFVAPTVFEGDSMHFNMSIADSVSRESFIGATNMEKGIYENGTNFYAPFYRQVGLICYQMRGYDEVSENDEVEAAFSMAYADVESAFEYYLEQSDKPFVLAGFSQGSEILIKLIKNHLNTKELQDRHIATYAIGWHLEQSDVNKYPQLKNAKSEDDLGVVVTFSTEAEFVEESIIVPSTTLAINPLSWTTDTTLAPSSLNLGACFTDYSGNIVEEIENFTSAYISSSRGTLKVPDVDPDEYPPIIPLFNKGEYHIYDYMFFYRNLQQNVQKRIARYKKAC